MCYLNTKPPLNVKNHQIVYSAVCWQLNGDPQLVNWGQALRTNQRSRWHAETPFFLVAWHVLFCEIKVSYHLRGQWEAQPSMSQCHYVSPPLEEWSSEYYKVEHLSHPGFYCIVHRIDRQNSRKTKWKTQLSIFWSASRPFPGGVSNNPRLESWELPILTDLFLKSSINIAITCTGWPACRLPCRQLHHTKWAAIKHVLWPHFSSSRTRTQEWIRFHMVHGFL